ncbi:hypothetical protein CY34DRAFT_642338 [Suillus luteus UH-Slu-Lm8-n1]|uniref:Uncharacterized protein n=1 Tax=Suillus luteus UH-Slu-Lm8-n1 TaxID=930992 RepID=A0A0D0BLZ7_9AGAM|nr:hypothetical protein CY34DRAFT_642338 [Suillus luteus UH-Slu-Lm8-n1]
MVVCGRWVKMIKLDTDSLGDMGPPGGWCYEGRHMTRFRTDSTIHDDKLVWRSGLFTQIIYPCAAPWYEIIYDLTPTAYGTPGSAGGLARINKLFGGKGYKQIFTSPPLLFGAFLSLHAAWVTLQALFIGSVLYRSTMYCLNHYYLIDVVGGACLAIGIRRYSSFNSAQPP